MGGRFCCQQDLPELSRDGDIPGRPYCACFSDSAVMDISSHKRSQGELIEEDPFGSASLSTFTLEADAADTLATALTELHEAARLFREGLCVEAAKKLAKAELLIDKSPKSPSKQRVWAVTGSDPDLKELRDMTSSPSFALENATGIAEDEESEPGFDQAPLDAVAGEPESDARIRESLKQRNDIMEQLEVDLAAVRTLCRSAQIFEARTAFEQLEASLADAQKAATEHSDEKMAKILQQLDSRLKGDPVLKKLRLIHVRMVEGLKMLGLSMQHKSAVHYSTTDPKLGDRFRLSLSLRFAEGDERVKDGPATQIIVRGELNNYPVPLVRVITENIEVDLFQKQWIKDCDDFSGKSGRAPRIFCSLMVVSLSPALLPIKIEDVILREFAVSVDDTLVPERGAGVIVIEHRPPDNVLDFEGMPIPPKRKGFVRIRGGMNAFYKSQSEDPGCSNIVAVSTMGLPVPQWMLPLTLLKRFAADLIMSSTKLMCEGLYGQWDELEYSKRTDTNPDLYKLVASLPHDKLGMARQKTP